jgi:hypothetical protein
METGSNVNSFSLDVLAQFAYYVILIKKLTIFETQTKREDSNDFLKWKKQLRKKLKDYPRQSASPYLAVSLLLLS